MRFRNIFIFLAFLALANAVFASSIHADLQKDLNKANASEEINAIIIYKSQQPVDVESIMKSEGAHVKRSFKLINGAAVKGNKKTLEKIAQKDFVKEIQPDYITNVTLDVSALKTGATNVWKENTTGKGIIIAVLDTGIHHHPAFENRIIKEVDFTIDGSTEDYYGHGTHVAGIIASNDPTYRGMAPGASLENVKVLNRYGWGYTSDIISGLDWAVINNADVISMSLGAAIRPCDGSDAMSLAVDNTVSKGVIVVVAAGNSGSSGGTINSPGCSKKAITVGAVDDNDAITWFSSRGPTGDGRTKPDIVAPGLYITSTSNGNGFVTFSGTSMATPHVSGVIALMLEANSSLTYSEVFDVLQQNATKLNYDSNTAGAGRIDAYSSYFTVKTKLPYVNETNMTNATNKTKQFKNVTNRTKIINIPPGFLKNWPKLRGQLPDSAQYKLKLLKEALDTYLDTNGDAACRAALDYAELRLAEMEEMARRDKPEYLRGLLDSYQAEMAKCDLFLKTRYFTNKTEIKKELLISSSMHKDVLKLHLEKSPGLKSELEKVLGNLAARDKTLLNDLDTIDPNFVLEYQLHEADKKINSGDFTGYDKEMQKVNARIERFNDKNIEASEAERLVAENTGQHLEILLTSYESGDYQSRQSVEAILLSTLTTRTSVVRYLKNDGGLGKVAEVSQIEQELESKVPSVAKSSENSKNGNNSSDNSSNGGNGGNNNAGGNGGSSGGSSSAPGNSGNAPGHNK